MSFGRSTPQKSSPRLDGSTTWNVSYDNGERDQVPERLLLREQPAAQPRGDEDITFEEQLARARAMEVTPERKRKGGDSVASAAKRAQSDVGGPRDPKVAKLFFQFLYQRATQRRLMYPRETVVGANGPLPPAALPTKGTDAFDHGAQLIAVTKFGNVGRYLDSGDQTTGRFVRAKLKHKGVEPGSTQWLARPCSCARWRWTAGAATCSRIGRSRRPGTGSARRTATGT